MKKYYEDMNIAKISVDLNSLSKDRFPFINKSINNHY